MTHAHIANVRDLYVRKVTRGLYVAMHANLK